MRASKKKIILSAALLLALAGAVWGIYYLKSVSDYKRAVRETVIGEPDISDIADGTYVGEYDVGFIYAKVEVSVRDGEISGIEILEHRNGRGEAAEAVVDRIIDGQRLDVDAVSGATNSSTVIKKAVENALKD